MNVAIVKYNAGNVYSVISSLERLGVNPVLTDDAETLAAADRVLFPGQGEAKRSEERRVGEEWRCRGGRGA